MSAQRTEPFGWRSPRGSYFGRGNVKFAILALLEEQPRHGYDIIREMEERSGGVYSPSPGVIYPTLQALEDQDYVKSVEQEGKKVYSITEAGINYRQSHQENQGRTRHGEGFRPPFPPPFPFGPGRRAGHGTDETGTTGQSGAGSAEASASKETPRQERPGGHDRPEWVDGPGSDQGRKGRKHGPHGRNNTAWGPLFAASGGPELMRELRWMFSDFANAVQRTLGDPQKLREIREVLRETKTKLDDIVMR